VWAGAGLVRAPPPPPPLWTDRVFSTRFDLGIQCREVGASNDLRLPITPQVSAGSHADQITITPLGRSLPGIFVLTDLNPFSGALVGKKTWAFFYVYIYICFLGIFFTFLYFAQTFLTGRKTVCCGAVRVYFRLLMHCRVCSNSAPFPAKIKIKIDLPFSRQFQFVHAEIIRPSSPINLTKILTPSPPGIWKAEGQRDGAEKIGPGMLGCGISAYSSDISCHS
jgi:hypothetical protein